MIPTRFLADSSLMLLARRLRMLGFDVGGRSGARLADLFQAAAEDPRTVLTPSRMRPPRDSAVAVLIVAREDPAAAIRAVASAHAPSGMPFSRCPACNVPLQPRHRLEASGEIPGRVLRSAAAITYCPGCGKWYWDGTHVARLRAWFAGVLGRPLEDWVRSGPARDA